jgi:hypothetical protein
MSASKPCPDCGSTTRPRKYPAGRCYTCHRAATKGRRDKAHGARLEAVYGITRAEYDAIFEHQGGACYICQRAKGITRNLCVDHDHATEHLGMRQSVRGLLCATCNKMLGHARDEPGMFLRAVAYLKNPPAKEVL